MTIGTIAARYAKALLKFAGEKNSDEAVYNDCLVLRDIFIKVPRLPRALSNPLLSADKKKLLIGNALGGRPSEVLTRFIDLVLRWRREDTFIFIVNSYIGLYREKHNISVVGLTTATPADAHIIKRIGGMVGNKTGGTVEFTQKVSEDIIGGFIFRLDTYRLDASVATQLNRMRNQFSEMNSRLV